MLRKERVTEAEVRSILRSQQINALDDVEAVVMESNGQFSVVPRKNQIVKRSSLADVKTPQDVWPVIADHNVPVYQQIV